MTLHLGDEREPHDRPGVGWVPGLTASLPTPKAPFTIASAVPIVRQSLAQAGSRVRTPETGVI
jgi:hypothetical protein